MQKSKIKSDDWILLALKNASERFGFNLTTWYFLKRPNDLELDLDQFNKTIENMEKEGLLQRASQISGNYCLTDRGKKEATKIKKRLKFDDYYFIISKFPEIELKERIETLEVFIIATFLLVLVFYWGKIPVSTYGKNFYIFLGILAVFTFVFTLSLFHFIFNFVKIIFFWTVSLQRDTLWRYKEWLWNNQNKIIYPIPFLLILMILYVIYIMNIIQWQYMLWGLVIVAISQLITHYKKIVEVFRSIFENYLK